MDLFKELFQPTGILYGFGGFYEKCSATRNGIAFGLLNNEEKDIQVYFDMTLYQRITLFHPNTNE